MVAVDGLAKVLAFGRQLMEARSEDDLGRIITDMRNRGQGQYNDIIGRLGSLLRNGDLATIRRIGYSLSMAGKAAVVADLMKDNDDETGLRSAVRTFLNERETRSTGTRASALEYIQGKGFTPEEAEIIFRVYTSNQVKAIKFRYDGSAWNFTHGAWGDKEPMQRALEYGKAHPELRGKADSATDLGKDLTYRATDLKQAADALLKQADSLAGCQPDESEFIEGSKVIVSAVTEMRQNAESILHIVESVRDEFAKADKQPKTASIKGMLENLSGALYAAKAEAKKLSEYAKGRNAKFASDLFDSLDKLVTAFESDREGLGLSTQKADIDMEAVQKDAQAAISTLVDIRREVADLETNDEREQSRIIRLVLAGVVEAENYLYAIRDVLYPVRTQLREANLSQRPAGMRKAIKNG